MDVIMGLTDIYRPTYPFIDGIQQQNNESSWGFPWWYQDHRYGGEKISLLFTVD
jgi:hypothetical protein